MYPTITIRGTFAPVAVDIPTLMARIASDEEFDAAYMPSHVRPSAVTLFAVMLACGRHYASGDLKERNTWDQLFEGLPMKLAPDEDEAGFLQPVVPEKEWYGEKGYNKVPFEDIGWLRAANMHDVKYTHRLPGEQALFSLISGLYRISNGRGHFASYRERVITVLASPTGTFSSEVRALAEEYGKSFRSKDRLADHFLWSTPWHKALNDLPTPFVDCRPVRLERIGDDLYEASRLAVKSARFSKSCGVEPHIIMDGKGSPYKLIPDKWTSAFLNECLFLNPPSILNATKNRFIRISGAEFNPNPLNPLDWREAVFVVPSRRDRGWALANNVKNMRTQLNKTVTKAAMHAFMGIGEHKKKAKKQAEDMAKIVGYEFEHGATQLIIDLLRDDIDDQKADEQVRHLMLNVVQTNWIKDARFSFLVWAEATDILKCELHKKFRLDIDMAFQDAFSDHINQTLFHIHRKIPDDYRPRLRRDSLDRIDVFRSALLLEAREEDRNTEFKEKVWDTVLGAFGFISHGGMSIGKSLAHVQHFHQDRVNMLLNAEEETILPIFKQMIVPLEDHFHAVNLTDLVALLLSGDVRYREKIAMDYVRELRWMEAKKRKAA